MVTLRLNSEQTEIVGFALTLAKREQLCAASMRHNKGAIAEGYRERAARLEEVRAMLDSAPDEENAPAILIALKSMVAAFNVQGQPDPLVAFAAIERARAAIEAAEHGPETERFLRQEEERER